MLGHDQLRTSQNISPPLPTPMLQAAAGGNLKQIFAEALFVKAAVFYGGQPPGSITEANLTSLGANYLVMSQLHPKLIDIYYLAEAVLAWEGGGHTRMANRVLQNGRRALPDSVLLPFFEGFNYFRFLGDYPKAAETLFQASEIPGAPRWLRHLAVTLQAEGGNIRAGLIWLKGMLSTTSDEYERRRYLRDIHVYEQALRVQSALEHYRQRTGRQASRLQDLVPTDLTNLPNFEAPYELEYHHGQLRLRAEAKK